MSGLTEPIQTELLRQASGYLGEYLGKIRECASRLDAEQLWWRPHAAGNSVGNLLLHLCGNLTQWILSGLGGQSDDRRRPEEFAADRTHEAAELIRRLEGVVTRGQATLADLETADLSSPRVVQGGERSGLEVVFHAVEHMSYHTGQIVYVAKMLLGEGGDLDFYPELKGR